MSSLVLSIYTIASGEQFWRKKKLVGKKKWSKRFILRSLARSPYDTTGCSLSIRLHMSQRSFKQKHFNIQRCLLFKAKTKGKFVSRKGIHEQSKFSKWMKRKTWKQHIVCDDNEKCTWNPNLFCSPSARKLLQISNQNLTLISMNNPDFIFTPTNYQNVTLAFANYSLLFFSTLLLYFYINCMEYAFRKKRP